MQTNHASIASRAIRLQGNLSFQEHYLKFHTPFTIAEADDILTQAEARRDELDQQYATLVDGIAWFAASPELQPKRPFSSIAYYFERLQKTHAEIQRLQYAIDEATRGKEAIVSEQMWELAQSMGLKYPQLECQHD